MPGRRTFAFVETLGPAGGPGCAAMLHDAVVLAGQGHGVRVYLFGDGVEAAVHADPAGLMNAGHADAAGPVELASAAGVRVIVDRLSADERALTHYLTPSVEGGGPAELAADLLAGATPLWH